jgi:molybdopterin/thiamine biosynthesis adenylyltransferase
MTIRIAASALVLLLRLFAQALARGIEMHAYALGRRTSEGVRIEEFVSVRTAQAAATIVQPDYGDAARALAPRLANGLHVVGEIHSHLHLVGPSSGDVRTLHELSGSFPAYECLVIAPGKRTPTITAHAVIDGKLVEHQVVLEEYALLDRKAVAKQKLLIIGNGSGTAAATPSLLKFGFDEITVADPDRFEERNIDRHLADHDAIGTPKVEYFERFAAGRTTSRIRTLQLALSASTIDTFAREVARHDILFNGTGHPAVSARLSYLARQYEKPIVHGGVFPRGSGGFVFLDTPGAACYSCLFDLQLQPTADDAETMRTLTTQYGLTDDQLAAQLGLWPDVAVIASLHVKVLLEYLKGKATHNLYLVDNEHVTIERHNVAQRATCICTGETA